MAEDGTTLDRILDGFLAFREASGITILVRSGKTKEHTELFVQKDGHPVPCGSVVVKDGEVQIYFDPWLPLAKEACG